MSAKESPTAASASRPRTGGARGGGRGGGGSAASAGAGRGRLPAGRWTGPVVGLLVVAAALGAAQSAAALARSSNPVVAVGDAVVDLSPTWLVEAAIDLLGAADKIVLLAGVLVVLAVSACALGTVALRRPAAGYAGLAVFAAAGLAATWLRRADDPGAALPVVCAALAGALALSVLLRGAGVTEGARGRGGVFGGGGVFGRGGTVRPGGEGGTGEAGEADEGRGAGRRFVLTAAGVLAASGAAGALGLRLPSLLGTTGPEPSLALPPAARPLPALSAGTDLGIPELAPFTTPNHDFYRIDTALAVPRLDASRWRLRVHGLVDRPFEIDMDELLGLPLVEADITLSCVSNPVGGQLVGNSRWLGFPLADLLRRAGVRSGADQILSTSHDGWTCGTPTATVMDGRDALLAVGMNGRPLPHEHGFPARLVVPGLFGYVSATKWVTDIELTRFADAESYWEDRGWAERGPVKTMSRVDVPGDFTRTGAGDVVLAGVAWSQHTGIEAVEVRVDDGAWWTADLARVPGADTWVQWVTETRVGPGMHAVEVRATDSAGRTQSSAEVETIPDGAEGRHRIRFTAE